MYPKLEETLKKYLALEQQMADPAVSADGVKYGKLAKEHGSLAKQARPYQELKKLVADLDALNADLAKEQDPEMRALIEEEIATKTKERGVLQAKIEDMLLVDPGEDFDSIIVEVRAGTGGD